MRRHQPPRLSPGGPFDLMSRRVIAANHRSIAERIAREIQAYAPPRDDAPREEAPAQ